MGVWLAVDTIYFCRDRKGFRSSFKNVPSLHIANDGLTDRPCHPGFRHRYGDDCIKARWISQPTDYQRNLDAIALERWSGQRGLVRSMPICSRHGLDPFTAAPVPDSPVSNARLLGVDGMPTSG